ncbi:MAG TPA: AsmA-like C-terminal region-containing protein, partial [Puia sp.]|nr:AsmA-like C-terminal region-containing protein [Puia sp.]
NLFTTLRMTATNDVYLDTLRAEMAGGKLTAQAHIDGTDPKKIYLYSTLGVEDMNIEKLMLKLDNFGEDVVINKNVQGIISGQIKSTFLIHPDFTPQIDQSQAEMDLEILNGVLTNFTPMQAMSSYFADKNLMKVRFDTLRNTLTFKNGALYIPDMNINSSLGFMEISGKQSMNMQMEYYIRIPLKLVTQAGFHKLFGKKQEEVDPNQVDAIEYRDKDKHVHFINLKISGTPDAYKVGLGKAKKNVG